MTSAEVRIEDLTTFLQDNGQDATWASRRRLSKPARMPKSDAPMDARVKWGRMLLDAREARKC